MKKTQFIFLIVILCLAYSSRTVYDFLASVITKNALPIENGHTFKDLLVFLLLILWEILPLSFVVFLFRVRDKKNQVLSVNYGSIQSTKTTHLSNSGK